MPVVLEGPEYVYVNESDFLDDPYVIHLRKELGEHLKNIPSDHSKIRINKMSSIAPDVDEESFVKDMGADFDVVIHGQGIIEINPAGISKATGIRKVCEMLDIPHENTFAFGDSANDLEMLAYVAHSIAMGNSSPKSLFSKVSYVTGNASQGGIMQALAHFDFI